MASDLWRALGLEPARHEDFEALDDSEIQPSPWKIASIQAVGEDEVQHLQTLEDWRDQDPVERIVNTILLCAIRDGAQEILIDPQENGVHVRFTTSEQMRDHIKLPMFTLAPIAERVKKMAQLDTTLHSAQQGFLKLRVRMAQLNATLVSAPHGQLKLRNEQEYDLLVSTHTTLWGERIELRFAS